MKVGMIAQFDKWGVRHPCTVMVVDNCQITQVKDESRNGYTSLQLGVGEAKEKNVAKPQLHHMRAAGVPVKREMGEFRVTPDALIPAGTTLSARHFVPGQMVDVTGTSKGKGFQGGMKRHNFAGQPASHGNSVSHRALGSTGCRQDPGKVWKGKKMPGHMGVDRITVMNLKVFKIDPARNLVFIHGQVPGNNGGFVRIRDALKGAKFPTPPPFPTFLGAAESDAIQFAPAPAVDTLKPLDVVDPF